MASDGRTRAGRRCQFRLTRANAAADGANVSPARSGESPSPPCRCRARVKNRPPNVVMTANSATIPRATPGSRSTRPGTSGDPPRAATRRSVTAKPANSTALPPRQAQTQPGQCSGWPSTSGTTRASTASASVTRPGRSRPRPAAARPAGSCRAPATSSATPIGTFTRNTGRQPSPNRLALSSRPPAICPTTTPPASTAAYALMARARGAPLNVRWIRLSTCGIIMAAPVPWTKRSATSTPVDEASPQPSEASVNTDRPARNTRRWPSRSPRRAPVTSSTA
jgi:hypothetical protein